MFQYIYNYITNFHSIFSVVLFYSQQAKLVYKSCTTTTSFFYMICTKPCIILCKKYLYWFSILLKYWSPYACNKLRLKSYICFQKEPHLRVEVPVGRSAHYLIVLCCTLLLCCVYTIMLLLVTITKRQM